MQLQSLSTKTLFAGLAAGAIMLVASCGAEKAAKSDLSPVDYVNPASRFLPAIPIRR